MVKMFMEKTHNEKIDNQTIKNFAPKVVEGVNRLKKTGLNKLILSSTISK